MGFFKKRKREVKKTEPVQIQKKPVRTRYLRRNVNFSLFFFIIIILAALVGLTSYYQKTYFQQASVLKQKTEEFNTALQELNVKQTLLNQTSVKLQVESESKEQLGELYTGVKQEKEAVEQDLSKARDDLFATRGQLEQARAKLISTETELREKESDLNACEADKKELDNLLDDCKDTRDSYLSDLNTCCSEYPGASVC